MTAVDSARTTLLKDAVCDHWGRANCGSRYGTSEERKLYFEEIEKSRYGIEPYIPAFAGFEEGRDLRILEIRVGAASDFSHWVKNGAIVTGVDLADAAILLTRENLEMTELGTSRVGFRKPDVENPPCDDASFDIVYSWGVPALARYRAAASRGVLRALSRWPKSTRRWGLGAASS